MAKYVTRAEAEGFEPGGPPLPAEQWAALVWGWFPELVDPDLRHPLWARITPFHDRIKASLEVNTATTVWQRLRDEDGLDVSITTFRYLYTHLPEEVAHLVTAPRNRRVNHAPAFDAQSLGAHATQRLGGRSAAWWPACDRELPDAWADIFRRRHGSAGTREPGCSPVVNPQENLPGVVT